MGEQQFEKDSAKPPESRPNQLSLLEIMSQEKAQPKEMVKPASDQKISDVTTVGPGNYSVRRKSGEIVETTDAAGTTREYKYSDADKGQEYRRIESRMGKNGKWQTYEKSKFDKEGNFTWLNEKGDKETTFKLNGDKVVKDLKDNSVSTAELSGRTYETKEKDGAKYYTEYSPGHKDEQISFNPPATKDIPTVNGDFHSDAVESQANHYTDDNRQPFSSSTYFKKGTPSPAIPLGETTLQLDSLNNLATQFGDDNKPYVTSYAGFGEATFTDAKGNKGRLEINYVTVESHEDGSKTASLAVASDEEPTVLRLGKPRGKDLSPYQAFTPQERQAVEKLIQDVDDSKLSKQEREQAKQDLLELARSLPPLPNALLNYADDVSQQLLTARAFQQNSEQIKTSFSELIKTADQLTDATIAQRFGISRGEFNTRKIIADKVKDMSKSGQVGDEDTAVANKMEVESRVFNLLTELPIRARAEFAKGLSTTGNDADRQEAIKMLTRTIDQWPASADKPYIFQAALKAKPGQDTDFKKACEKAGQSGILLWKSLTESQ